MSSTQPSGRTITAFLAVLGIVLIGCGEESGPSNAVPTVTFTAQCNALGCSFANGSADADGTLKAYAWDFGDASAPVTTRDAAHTYAAPGSFIVKLTVTDDDGDSATATATVNPSVPQNPQADLTASFTVSCMELTCTFTDRSSARVAASYSWTFGDQSEPAATRDASHTYPGDGRYKVSLYVVDGKSTAVDTQWVSVESLNVPPTPDFIYDCIDLTCTFTDRSADPTGAVESYHWTFGDGETSSMRSPTHAFTSAGRYTVGLTVTDDRGATATASSEFTLPASGGPSAELEIGCYYSSCSYAAHVTAGTVMAWHWSFGDGATSTAERPSHEYGMAGTYLVQVALSDDHGGTTTLTREVTAPFPSWPTAAFTASCEGRRCTFDNQSTDGLAGVLWDFGDGATSPDWEPSHRYDVDEATTFTVTLTVWDFDLGINTASHEVTVTP